MQIGQLVANLTDRLVTGNPPVVNYYPPILTADKDSVARVSRCRRHYNTFYWKRQSTAIFLFVCRVSLA